ncbi:MAG: AbgT family transporter [Bacteroidales bacterium]|nr:AbgT family transporter [Bacteroidales bacterium]MCL2133009.1 AbgT family transporter [Bacteroidales bacterium]
MKRKLSVPHTYVIIFAVIVFCTILTWILPGGHYVRNETIVDGVMVQQVEFTYLDSNPQSWQIFSALYKGFVRQSGIIIFILMIGGAFWMVNSSRAIDVGIYSFLRSASRLERIGWVKKLGVGNMVIVMVMLLFSLFGAVFGMSEETIAFTIILVPLAISMGYDSITGVCMAYLAAHAGFAGAMLNPFTIGIAQGMAGLPLFSGLEYRFFCWVVINIFAIIFVLRYAQKVKRNPKKSPMYEEDAFWREKNREHNADIEYHTPRSAWFSYGLALIVMAIFALLYPATSMKIGNSSFTIPRLLPVIALSFAVVAFFAARKSVHFYILTLLGYTIVYLIVGVMGYEWYLQELSALFLCLGLLSCIAMGDSGNVLSKKFIEGAKDILSAALVVGLAGGIIVILEDGKVVDTILFKMSQAMNGVGQVASVGVMYLIQTAINIIIPSGSAKAALTMPIMAPFSDLIGVSRQATVMAFQFGDGFTNMITPTSGVLIGVLGLARIPYGIWFKWIWKFMLLLILLGFLLLIPTVLMNLNGF